MKTQPRFNVIPVEKEVEYDEMIWDGVVVAIAAVVAEDEFEAASVLEACH